MRPAGSPVWMCTRTSSGSPTTRADSPSAPSSAADRVDVEPGAVEQELGAVPPALLARRDGSGAATWHGRAGGLQVTGVGWEPQRRLAGSAEERRCGCRRLRVADGSREALEDHREAESAGVDDVRVAEHLQLVGGPLDRGVRLGDDALEDDAYVVGGLGGGSGRGSRVADDGEDRALGRLHHRPVRDRGRFGDRQRDAAGVEVGALRRLPGRSREGSARG